MNESAERARVRVFLNYRREEASGHARLLYDAMVAHLGREQVFWDIDTIDPGLDFVEVVDQSMSSADVVVALIGRQWLTLTDEEGRRRLDRPEDFVRLELEGALARGVRLIPALVQGASMPSSDRLPESLRRLAYRNAVELSDTRWTDDVARLLRAIDRIAEEKEARDREQRAAAQVDDRKRRAEEAFEADRARAERERREREERERRAARAPREPVRAAPAAQRFLRPAAVGLAGAGLVLVANFLDFTSPGEASSDELVGGVRQLGLPWFALETVAVPLVVAVALAAALAGRIHWQLATGAVLGFGLVSAVGAFGAVAFVVTALKQFVGFGGALGDVGAGSYLRLLGAVGILLAGVVASRSAAPVEVELAPPRAFRPLALAGAVLVVVGLLVPYAAFENPGEVAIVDTVHYLLLPSDSQNAFWFALQAFAVAAAAVVAVLVARATPTLTAGVLVALGVQTFLFFAGYVALAASNEFASLRSGAFVGATGAILIAAAGLSTLRAVRAVQPPA